MTFLASQCTAEAISFLVTFDRFKTEEKTEKVGRAETAFWQVMQMLLVILGVTHGFNGLRVVIEDYTGQSMWRPYVRGLIFLLWLFMLIIAVYVILAS